WLSCARRNPVYGLSEATFSHGKRRKAPARTNAQHKANKSARENFEDGFIVSPCEETMGVCVAVWLLIKYSPMRVRRESARHSRPERCAAWRISLFFPGSLRRWSVRR